MKKDFLVFEYRESEGRGEPCQMHYNNIHEDGTTDAPIFSNGYRPVAVIPADLVASEKWGKFVDGIGKKKLSYNEVFRATIAWLINHGFRP